ncbi:MAG: iron ABC transporter permease [Rhizobiaceae bacterium]|nr:iron ABC transporter permease [Rhizobiaceae bacterium]
MSTLSPLAKSGIPLRLGTQRGTERLYLAGGIAIALTVLLPIVALAVIAVSGTAANWSHLAQTILPEAARVTLLLMLGIALVAGSTGVVTAWLVASFQFPGRGLFAWALVLPLAVPTYIAAYGFNEFLHFTGPVQTGIRALFGFSTRRDYWFPEIRSLGGAIFILSAVLYPYIFLTVRMVFLMQGRKVGDVARTLGATRAAVFFKVLLPMARPAIAIGVALALMEAINDIGAVEFLGVRTLTFAVYSTWLNRGDLQGATQIALMMLGVIVLLVVVERLARRQQRYSVHRGDRPQKGREALRGAKAALAVAACLLPIAFGFGIPFAVLLGFALQRLEQASDPQLWRALWHTVAMASATGVVTVAAGFMMAYGIRLTQSRRLSALVRMGALGYAVPGTVLAIGILIPLAAFDNAVDAALRSSFGISSGLFLSGSGFAIVYACSVRFMAMGHGAIESGFSKLSPHLDMAARTLGRGPGGTMREILLPLMRPALLTSFLLVFVDSTKELSATILLRPFDFETLATFVYTQASRSAFEDGALAALLIVVTGIVPVVLLTRTIMADGREG